MQHVKVKYSEKPHLKEGAGWWSRTWYNWRVWHGNHKYNRYDQHRKSVTIRLLGLLGIGVTIIAYSMIMPRPSGTVSTKLNQEMAFGNQGANVQLTEKSFNEDSGLLELHFKFTGNNNESTLSGINMKRYKLSFAGDRYIQSGQSEYHIIPTSANTMVVQFEKLKTNFQDVRVMFEDKTVDTADINIATNESDSSVKKTQSSDQLATVIVNNDDQLHLNNKLDLKSKKQLVIAQTSDNIQEQQRHIKKDKAAIKKWQTAIDEQEENVKSIHVQMKDMTDDEQDQASESIETYESKITDFKKDISNAKEDISDERNKIQQLEKQKTKQQNGQLNVAKLSE